MSCVNLADEGLGPETAEQDADFQATIALNRKFVRIAYQESSDFFESEAHRSWCKDLVTNDILLRRAPGQGNHHPYDQNFYRLKLERLLQNQPRRAAWLALMSQAIRAVEEPPDKTGTAQPLGESRQFGALQRESGSSSTGDQALTP